MTREIYRCQVCSSTVAVLSQEGGALSCCGAPLILLKESGGSDFQDKSEALIDLVEVMDNGKSCWQFFQTGESPGVAWMNGAGVKIPNQQEQGFA